VSRVKLPPHPMNAPGPFYVEHGCCITCGVPETEAPQLFGSHDAHCFVRRQPETPNEADQMMDTMLWSEVDCIRYRGTDRDVIQRLGENGLMPQVDFAPDALIDAIVRSYVRFDVTSAPKPKPLDLANQYKSHLQSERDYKFRGPHKGLFTTTTWLEYSWYQEKYHRITFSRAPQSNGYLINIQESAATRALARNIQNWLKSNSEVTNPIWFTAQQWQAGGTQGSSKPM
jgi:hypothetical protein